MERVEGMRITQRLVHVNGVRGLILEAGAERAARGVVVVLASTLVLARSYLWPLREFARRFRTIVVESPGSGRGTRLKRPWSMQDYARWTGALLDTLDLRDVTLVGHSNSGAVATILAATNPRRLARLVLADSVGADRAGSLTRIIAARGLDCLLEPELTLQAWSHVLVNAVFHAGNFFEQVRLSARTDLTDVAPRVEVPTLVAWGRRDNTMPPRCGELLHSLIRGSRLYVSRDGSHDWINDHPREFADALERFMRETTRLAPSPCTQGEGGGEGRPETMK